METKGIPGPGPNCVPVGERTCRCVVGLISDTHGSGVDRCNETCNSSPGTRSGGRRKRHPINQEVDRIIHTSRDGVRGLTRRGIIGDFVSNEAGERTNARSGRWAGKVDTGRDTRLLVRPIDRETKMVGGPIHEVVGRGSRVDVNRWGCIARSKLSREGLLNGNTILHPGIGEELRTRRETDRDGRKSGSLALEGDPIQGNSKTVGHAVGTNPTGTRGHGGECVPRARTNESLIDQGVVVVGGVDAGPIRHGRGQGDLGEVRVDRKNGHGSASQSILHTISPIDGHQTWLGSRKVHPPIGNLGVNRRPKRVTATVPRCGLVA